MFGLLFSSIFSWQKIGKEEMPEISLNFLQVNIRYPGASAQDVEVFVIKPIEEQLKGVTGLDEVNSTSAYGAANLFVIFEASTTNLIEKVQEVKDAIDAAEMPREAEEPIYWQFKNSEMAIIDIGIFLKDKDRLDVGSRIKLQEYALAFKDRLLTQKEISGVSPSGYLRPELHINVHPDKLRRYEISMGEVRDQVTKQHVRAPIGSLRDRSESEVALVSELDDIEPLQKVIVSSGFQGQRLTLGKVADIEHGFERTNSIFKIQGHEGIVYRVTKSISADILSAQKTIINFIDQFKKANPESPVDFILMDDESYDVRNRLSLISTNGILGFLLIALILFLFLDFKSGFWVAMGIPFALAFTLIACLLVGYTVNNMTLAAVIIVLGIVVDDAIIVAENISRRRENGIKAADATMEVFAPVLASVLTTCVAFVPLLVFTGRFGLFIKYIPMIVFSMLAASLIESFFILPSHMSSKLPMEKWFTKFKLASVLARFRTRVIGGAEKAYEAALRKVLALRVLAMLFFIGLLGSAIYIYKNDLSYVMFPREESRDFRLHVTAPKGVTRGEMADKIKKIELFFLEDKHQVVQSVRTTIGQNRRGGEVRENEASMRVEILPPSERSISLNKLFEIWQKDLDNFKEFTSVRFQKSRFGSDSGSPLNIQVQANNDKIRRDAISMLEEELKNHLDLINVEVERPITKPEFLLELKKGEISSLGIDYQQLASTLRSYIEGEIIYTLNTGEEEVDVRFTVKESEKNDIQKLLNLTVANNEGYLVPLRGLVEVVKRDKPANIQRINYKRATSVFADIKEESGKTPLELAEDIESNIFPKVSNISPLISMVFRGEVEESRESQGDFLMSLIVILMLIYIILVFVFDSLWTPFLIGIIIPFGAVGVVFAFKLHNMNQYGFFAVIGTLGMIGVVINDSIVLIDQFKNKIPIRKYSFKELCEIIAHVSSQRLRAVALTTITTVAGLFPTAYGIGGYDSMLAEMMLAMGWGLLFGMFITLVLVPCVFSFYLQFRVFIQGGKANEAS